MPKAQFFEILYADRSPAVGEIYLLTSYELMHLSYKAVSVCVCARALELKVYLKL